MSESTDSFTPSSSSPSSFSHLPLPYSSLVPSLSSSSSPSPSLSPTDPVFSFRKSTLLRLLLSLTSGLLIGSSIKIYGRHTAIATSSSLSIIQMASSLGFITIHWDKIHHTIEEKKHQIEDNIHRVENVIGELEPGMAVKIHHHQNNISELSKTIVKLFQHQLFTPLGITFTGGLLFSLWKS